MSYLFSLLKDKSPDQLPSQVDSSILCYYINDTADTQIIRMVSESLCHFERIVFSSERLLFKAFLESHLESIRLFLTGFESLDLSADHFR
jgi:hypothetical protein